MIADESTVLYWDSSAIVSALFRDRHSEVAIAASKARGPHIVSSLCLAEIHAVMSRIAREGLLSALQIAAAQHAFEGGPWLRVAVEPDRFAITILARAWRLRGADLWHLAAAKTLQSDFPELKLLSFDERLVEAARGEGLAP